MAARGKHRRPKSTLLTRGLMVLGTGGAALALPAVGAVSAHAAPAEKPAVAEKSAAPSAADAKAAAEKTAAKKEKSGTYSVVAGDTLAKIADENSVKGGWEKLYDQNRDAVGEDPGLILPGLKLTIDGEEKASAETKSAGKGAAEAKPAAYSDNLDGWIRESLDIMQKNGIPGTYEGIHRNVMRESGGDPQAVNNWDVNAQKGTPSKGLLQVIAPTFDSYHVEGTSTDSLDPVANIVAACNYAADQYGSIDNVNGPY
ncbi:LysM peptidoglycan-binding domain-containing protein [Streptomyces sp. HNM0574]|uniref:LysM peptidoglycan-binding domain-containing protein n=1 Tax=Streptomyces sp. HNM0574 TaxID=2714954 RepID=UPI00146A843E|nr:LysM peptidoglycan-binding domain-containing protein [Streptomyces sp. HNM0574]NLU65777.1 transglycosylase SLT domain-containing protein [Streptomyces sp. HNM0574]